MHRRVCVCIYIHIQPHLSVYIHDIHTQTFNECKHKANVSVKVQPPPSPGAGIKAHPARDAIPAGVLQQITYNASEICTPGAPMLTGMAR